MKLTNLKEVRADVKSTQDLKWGDSITTKVYVNVETGELISRTYTDKRSWTQFDEPVWCWVLTVYAGEKRNINMEVIKYLALTVIYENRTIRKEN